jgi:hypothetical protein
MSLKEQLVDKYKRISFIVKALDKKHDDPEVATTAYETLIEEACEAQQIADAMLEARDMKATTETTEEILEQRADEIVEDLERYREQTGPTPAPAKKSDDELPF